MHVQCVMCYTTVVLILYVFCRPGPLAITQDPVGDLRGRDVCVCVCVSVCVCVCVT